MKSLAIILITLICLVTSTTMLGQTRHFPQGAHDIFIADISSVRARMLEHIAPIVEKSIASGNYPGAVILASHRGQIIYRGVFGSRRIMPDVAPMRFDTIFDIASLTKVVATTPAIMQLVEKGKLDLDAPVAKYWPAFAGHGKHSITVRELLTHTSGLPASISTNSWSGKTSALQQIEKLKLQNAVGTTFMYSDVNFIALAHLVELASHMRFEDYVRKHIFDPLALRDTYFLPSANLKDRIAPTDFVHHTLHWGQVQDPIASQMGGIAGNAGLFSDANDLGTYAQCLLNNGKVPHEKKYILGPLTILKMITPQTPANITNVRALGWDIDSAYSNRGVLFPVGSFGHTGWTGTSLWIDPATETWLVILTSRTHPAAAAQNNLIQDRRTIANIVSASITDFSAFNKKNTGRGELARAYTHKRTS